MFLIAFRCSSMLFTDSKNSSRVPDSNYQAFVNLLIKWRFTNLPKRSWSNGLVIDIDIVAKTVTFNRVMAVFLLTIRFSEARFRLRDT